MSPRRLPIPSLLVLAAALLGGGSRAAGDGGTGAMSVDAAAKQREDEFNELGKKKETIQSQSRRLALIKELAFAPCGTSLRFLTGLLKKSSAAGDERLYALDTLGKIADASAVETIVATLVREKDAALWQVFSESLLERPTPAVRAWFLGPGLQASNVETLTACLEGLARSPDKAAADRVATLFDKHSKSQNGAEVAAQALRALVRVRGADARPTLLAAVRHADARVRLAVADTLPSLEPFDAEAEAATRALLADESDGVRQTAAAQAGAARRQPLAAALVALLADPRVRTRHVAALALEQLSGQKLGHDVKAWTAWLEKKDPGKPVDLTVPTYHGIPFYSDRVVFLVDASDSMKWPWRKPTHRIDVARAELSAALRRLPADTLFNVVVFSDKQNPWKKAEVAATPENVAAAAAWAEKATAEPAGDTHLYDVLESAFGNDPQFDTIFLLTDGNPVSGKYWTNEGILAGVRAWTRNRRAAIHTVGLSLSSEDPGMPNLSENPAVMKALLSALASATTGEFREILQVPAAK